MEKLRPKVPSLALTAILTLLSSCKNLESEKQPAPSETPLTTFLSLHDKYCGQIYESSDDLEKALKNTPELAPAKGFEGVYESVVNNVSYAISPEDDGCTTDVMVKLGNNELFSFEDINRALLDLGYKEISNLTIYQDTGIDQGTLTVIEKKYMSPNGEITTLNFPLDKKDKYYMTLFAEKFSAVIQKRVLDNIKMAVR